MSDSGASSSSDSDEPVIKSSQKERKTKIKKEPESESRSSRESSSSSSSESSSSSSSDSEDDTSEKVNKSSRGGFQHESLFQGKGFLPRNIASPEKVSNELSLQTGLEPIKKKPPLLTAEELCSPKYEVWMVTTPASLDPGKLRNLELSLSQSSKLTIESDKYETTVLPKEETVAFLLPDSQNTIKTVFRKTAGTINLTNDVDIEKKKRKFLQPKKVTEIPKGFKRRHPIYGNDLEAVLSQPTKPKIPKQASKNDCLALGGEKKKKKKKEKEREDEKETEQQVEKKKKKKKDKEREEESRETELLESQKKKKKKKDKS